MKVKTFFSLAVCLLLLGATSSCYKKKPIEQMTNSELLEEYQRLEYEKRNPKQITEERSSGIPFDRNVKIIETYEQYFQRMIDEQLKVEEELNRRSLSPEEQRQFDSIMAPVYKLRQEILVPFPSDSLPDIMESSDSAVY